MQLANNVTHFLAPLPPTKMLEPDENKPNENMKIFWG
jgi:hypothetical protein